MVGLIECPMCGEDSEELVECSACHQEGCVENCVAVYAEGTYSETKVCYECEELLYDGDEDQD